MGDKHGVSGSGRGGGGQREINEARCRRERAKYEPLAGRGVFLRISRSGRPALFVLSSAFISLCRTHREKFPRRKPYGKYRKIARRI